MVRLRLDLAYDGTGFSGWAKQPGRRTVQGEIEEAFGRILRFPEPPTLTVAGRTDAGVHSIGQGVSFSAPASWTDSALRRALNALLPSDCWVESVHPMQPGFHARKSALSRRYQYRIGLDEASASPFRRQFEWALGKPLDLELLSAATQVIRGEHDFRAFAAKTDKPHYRCRVIHAEWTRRTEGREVSLQIEADRFLQRMVRMLVGTMVDIGLERRPLEDMAVLLRRDDNAETSPPAPPQGLYFAAVVYPPELFADPAGEPHAALHLA